MLELKLKHVIKSASGIFFYDITFHYVLEQPVILHGTEYHHFATHYTLRDVTISHVKIFKFLQWKATSLHNFHRFLKGKQRSHHGSNLLLRCKFTIQFLVLSMARSNLILLVAPWVNLFLALSAQDCEKLW